MKKNIILKKELPSVNLDGVIYERPKGTVYGYHEKDQDWCLLTVCGTGMESDDITNCWLDKKDLKANKDWYGMTTKKPTYKKYYIDGDEIIYNEGSIKVGCQEISNEVVRYIADNLIDEEN